MSSISSAIEAKQLEGGSSMYEDDGWLNNSTSSNNNSLETCDPENEWDWTPGIFQAALLIPRITGSISLICCIFMMLMAWKRRTRVFHRLIFGAYPDGIQHTSLILFAKTNPNFIFVLFCSCDVAQACQWIYWSLAYGPSSEDGQFRIVTIPRNTMRQVTGGMEMVNR